MSVYHNTTKPDKVPPLANIFTENEIAGVVENLFSYRRSLVEMWEVSKHEWTESPDGTRSKILDNGMKLVLKTVKQPRCTCCGR